MIIIMIIPNINNILNIYIIQIKVRSDSIQLLFTTYIE